MQNDTQIEFLLARFFSGEATPEEAMQLEDWKAASAANKKHFDGAARIFASNDIKETEIKQQAWINIKAKIDKTKKPGKIITSKWWKLSIAASVVLLVSLGILFKYSNTKPPEAPESIVYKTDSSAQKIQLRDGSDIVLAINSSITLDKDFGKTNRNVSLNGSAFFSVKHDSILPFLINMKQLHVKDVGTKFHITSKADTVLVTMEEGEVLLYDDFGAKQRLVGNEKAGYVKSVRKIELYRDTLNKKEFPKDEPKNKKNTRKKIKPPVTHTDSTNLDDKGPVKSGN